MLAAALFCNLNCKGIPSAIARSHDRTSTLIRHTETREEEQHRPHPRLSVLSPFSQNRLQPYLSSTGLQVTAEDNRETERREHTHTQTHRENPQARSQTQTFKQLDCMRGDGRRGPPSAPYLLSSRNEWTTEEDGWGAGKSGV